MVNGEGTRAPAMPGSMLLPPVVSKDNHGSVFEAARLKTRTEVSKRVRPAPSPTAMRRARLPCRTRRIFPRTSKPSDGVGAPGCKRRPGATHSPAFDMMPSATSEPILASTSSSAVAAAASNSTPRRTSKGRTERTSGRTVGARAAFSRSCSTLTDEQPVARKARGSKSFIAAASAGHNGRVRGNRVCRSGEGTTTKPDARPLCHSRSVRPRTPSRHP